MTFLTRPFLGFIFAVEPIWLPLLIVDAVTLSILVFKERFEPRTLIFWVSATVILPFAGALLYLLFGCTLISSGIFGRKRGSDLHSDVIGDGVGSADIRLYWDLREAMADMASDMASAQEVHVMLRRIPKDPAFSAMIADTARSGKHVMLMTSTFGFGRTRGLRTLRSAGVEFATFRNRLTSTFSMRPANRNMRQIITMDGSAAYICTGPVIRITGSPAAAADMRFASDWAFATGEMPSAPESCTDGGPVSLISSGPDCGGAEPASSCYAKVLAASRETVLMTAPYLTPDDVMYSHIKLAVFSGADVRILLPRRGAHWYQSWNSLAASNPLMMAGAHVYFTDRPVDRMIMVSDGSECVISSGSYTTRSLRDDLNICMAIRSVDAASFMADHLEDELSEAVECLPEEYRRRSAFDMIKIAASRMLMFLN